MQAKAFLDMLKSKQKLMEFDANLMNRSLNEGFSGGEKKRNDIFPDGYAGTQTGDHGRNGFRPRHRRPPHRICRGEQAARNKDNAFIIITHYQRLLEYIVPDFVHVLYNGRIVKSGTKELALELEEKGYDWLKEDIRLEEPVQ